MNETNETIETITVPGISTYMKCNMSRNNANHLNKSIEILNEFKDGKEIWRHCLADTANFTEYKIDRIDIILHWLLNEPDSLYVKKEKEPALRPYNNAKEFLSAMKEHGPYYIQIDLKEENFYMLPNSVTDNGFCTYNDMLCTFKGFMERFEWQDGTPCGVKK